MSGTNNEVFTGDYIRDMENMHVSIYLCIMFSCPQNCNVISLESNNHTTVLLISQISSKTNIN